jgi:flagellar basal body-associated protein FliL
MEARQEPREGTDQVQGKLKFILPLVVLIVLGGAYKTVLAKPAEKKPEPKVHGQVYVIPKEFLINLAEDRYAKLSVALVLPHEEPIAAPEGHGAAPPEGWGTLPQEAVVRELITDTLTGAHADKLTDPEERDGLKKKLLVKFKKYSDVHVEEVLLTDIAVQ